MVDVSKQIMKNVSENIVKNIVGKDKLDIPNKDVFDKR